MKYRILSPFLLLLTVSACTTINIIELVIPSQPAAPDSTDEVDIQTPFPTQTVLAEPLASESANNVSREVDQMPVFLEMIQTTIMGEKPRHGPSLGVGPNIYIYNSDSQVLALRQTIVVNPSTELLIGITNILQTPNQEYTKREIVQYPSMQPVLIEVSAFDAETGAITMIYEGDEFNLLVGESRTFKQAGEHPKASKLITVISNHGPLAEIQPVSSDGSWR